MVKGSISSSRHVRRGFWFEFGHLSNESSSFVQVWLCSNLIRCCVIVFNYELDLCMYCISFEFSFIMIIINLFFLIIPNSNPTLVSWKEEFSNAVMRLQRSLGLLRAQVPGFLIIL